MDYLKYIPIVSTNPQVNAVILTIFPAIFYVLAAYGHLFINGLSLSGSIVMAIIFAAIEYTIRIPIIKYSSEVALLSNSTMQIIWIVLTYGLSAMTGFITTKI